MFYEKKNSLATFFFYILSCFVHLILTKCFFMTEDCKKITLHVLPSLKKNGNHLSSEEKKFASHLQNDFFITLKMILYSVQYHFLLFYCSTFK